MLLLDEPTKGIQPNVVAEMERIIVDLASRGGLSVLLVEQHVGFSLRASGQYYVMESGRIWRSEHRLWPAAAPRSVAAP